MENLVFCLSLLSGSLFLFYYEYDHSQNILIPWQYASAADLTEKGIRHFLLGHHGKLLFHLLSVMIVTTLVSVPNPAPSTFRLLATIMSICFFLSFALEFSAYSGFPWKIRTKLPFLRWLPSQPRISSVRSGQWKDRCPFSLFSQFPPRPSACNQPLQLP